MKKNIRKAILMLCFNFILFNCVSYKNQLFIGEGSLEQARTNIIVDFSNTYKTPRKYLTERNDKPFDVFLVRDREYEINNDILVFSVLPEHQGYITLKIEDSLGKVPRDYLPNKYKISNKKLFLWNDGITPLQKDILLIMDKYKVLDSTDVKRKLGLLPDDFEDTRMVIFDDNLKGVDYYVCKNHIEKYKKRITNKAFGYYEPPNLNCK